MIPQFRRHAKYDSYQLTHYADGAEWIAAPPNQPWITRAHRDRLVEYAVNAEQARHLHTMAHQQRRQRPEMELPGPAPHTFARVVEDNQARANGTYTPPRVPERRPPIVLQKCSTCHKDELTCRCLPPPPPNVFECVVVNQRADGRLA